MLQSKIQRHTIQARLKGEKSLPNLISDGKQCQCAQCQFKKMKCPQKAREGQGYFQKSFLSI